MCRQNIVDAALDLKRELEQFERTKDRSVLIEAITRCDSAMLVEMSKLAALEILIGRMAGMSDNMLIRTIEILFQIGVVDMNPVNGSGQVKR
jgi:hypothetical protein